MRGNRGLTPIIENDDGIIILSSVGAGWIFVSSLIIVLYGVRPSKDSYAAPAPIKVCPIYRTDPGLGPALYGILNS